MVEQIDILEKQYNFNEEEKEAFYLMGYYFSLIKNEFVDTDYWPKKNPKEYKYFNCFLELVKKSKNEDYFIFSPKKYIDILFEKYGIMCNPQKLLSNNSLEIYYKHLYEDGLLKLYKNNHIEKKQNDNDIKMELYRTYEMFSLYSYNWFGINYIDYKKLIKHPFFNILINNNLISKYFLCISKTCGQLLIDNIENKKYYYNRMINNDNLYKYALELYGDEIDGNKF